MQTSIEKLESFLWNKKFYVNNEEVPIFGSELHSLMERLDDFLKSTDILKRTERIKVKKNLYKPYEDHYVSFGFELIDKTIIWVNAAIESDLVYIIQND